INTNGPVGDINMPVGALINPQVTKKVTVGGNLPSNATMTVGAVAGTQISTTITVYDDNGGAKSLVVQMTRGNAADDTAATAGHQRWRAMLQADTDPTTPDGTITGVFSNGRTQNIAQIALANFSNPAGLEKLEGSMYRPTANSGLATIGIAGLAGRGTLAGGTLEMSNVDLAQEFTNLIV